jgi:hypothetical protein
MIEMTAAVARRHPIKPNAIQKMEDCISIWPDPANVIRPEKPRVAATRNKSTAHATKNKKPINDE